MLTNDMVRKVSELQRENRRLKSRQTIMGSTVATGASSSPVQAINIPAGTPFGTSVVGKFTVTMTGIDGASITSAPMVAFNIIASTSSNIVVGTSDLPQYPTQGGLSFNYAPASMSNSGVATINFVLTLNYEISQQGGNIYYQVFSSGTALMSSVTAEWHGEA